MGDGKLLVGRPVARREDVALLRGEGRYTDDLTPDNAAHLVFVRSPVAAGKIVALDAEGAREMPGVLAVIDADTLDAAGVKPFPSPAIPPHLLVGDLHAPTFPALARDEVHHLGQPILAIVAETVAEAMDAAEMVDLEFEDRPAITDLTKAKGGPAVWPTASDNRIFRVELGDAAATQDAMDTAAHRVTRRLSINRVTAVSMEPRGAIGSWDAETGGYVMTSGTQATHRLAEAMAAQMGVPEGDVRVVSENCGGTFGMKNGGMPEYPPILVAARHLGRPVRWIETRSEAFLSDPQAREQVAEATLALDAEGRFLGLSVDVVAGIGAYANATSLLSSFNNIASVTGVYGIPAIRVAVEGVHLNTQTTAAYRGAGRPEASFIIERMIDVAARETGIDRVELRRRNMLQPEELPRKTALGYVYDSGDFPALFDRALQAADWAGVAARKQEAQARGKLRGAGLAYTIEIAGGPPAKPMPEYASATLSPEGCRLMLGTGDAGQGHDTAFAQIAADAFGLGLEKVSLFSGDTGVVPKGTGSFGSRSLGAAGSVLVHVCEDLIAQLCVHAARQLDAEAEALTFEDGTFKLPGTNRAISLESLLAEDDLTVTAERWEGTKGPSFPNGCHIAEVEVDPETGEMEICSYTALEDIGKVINPLLVAGQIHGGIVQGLGQGMMEAIRYDDDGQLLTGSFMDYAMPRASDLPFFNAQTASVETASNTLGTKGVGEAGTVGALPVLSSAIADALAPLGVDHVTLPATPSAIWEAIQAAQA